MSESEQRATNVKLGRGAVQTTTAGKATQEVDHLEAAELKQEVRGHQTLQIGKYRAVGVYAIVAVVIILVLGILARAWMAQQ
jgi:hypothetical protein